MTLGIMQPYFMPYIGYWQLMAAVDKYVVYDNIEYTKKGWINRNRILQNEKDEYITLPLKKDSDYLSVNQRFLSDVFDRNKLIRQIESAYRKAPYFRDIFPVVVDIIGYDNGNLFQYIYYSITKIRNLLGITSELIISSSVNIDETLKGKDKVLALCKALGADTYYNAIGGQSLYDKQEFLQDGISLYFLQTADIQYPQFRNDFVANLSIIDVLMFNSLEQTRQLLTQYTLV